MDKTKIPRKERERRLRRKEILQAALKLFSQKGYQNVSMQEIAHESEFSVGTLYNFFENKEDLYRALVFEHATMFYRILRDVLEEDIGVSEKLEKFMEVKGRVFMENADAVRIYFAETRGASFHIRAGLDKDIRTYYEDTLRQLSHVFQTGIDQGIFRPLNPYYLAVSIDALLNAFLFYWLENPKEHPFEKNIQLIKEIFFKGVSTQT